MWEPDIPKALVKGGYEYTIGALDNPFGWVTGRTVPDRTFDPFESIDLGPVDEILAAPAGADDKNDDTPPTGGKQKAATQRSQKGGDDDDSSSSSGGTSGGSTGATVRGEAVTISSRPSPR